MFKVFCQGSFDIINAGHIRTFRDLKKKYPDSHLIIGLNSTELMLEHKGREIIPFEQRKEILMALKDVDEVVKCDSAYAIDYVRPLGVDAFATVPEWTDRQKEVIDWVTSQGGQIVLLKYYPDDGEILSSTQIRERVIKGAK